VELGLFLVAVCHLKVVVMAVAAAVVAVVLEVAAAVAQQLMVEQVVPLVGVLLLDQQL
jgi:hypothetical protein